MAQHSITPTTDINPATINRERITARSREAFLAHYEHVRRAERSRIERNARALAWLHGYLFNGLPQPSDLDVAARVEGIAQALADLERRDLL